MSTQTIIFSVKSAADFGGTEYFLDETGYTHIVQGHRDLANVVMTGVQETVKNPTHVYKSDYDVRRLQFVSYGVTTKGGHPMNVIVEMQPDSGRIITASPKKQIRGTIIWDMSSGLYASYDERSDILYLSHGDSRTSYADDDPNEPRIWLRYHDDDDSPAGVTIFNASRILKKESELKIKISNFLHVNSNEVENRIKQLVP